jgi:hypothetical protein
MNDPVTPRIPGRGKHRQVRRLVLRRLARQPIRRAVDLPVALPPSPAKEPHP